MAADLLPCTDQLKIWLSDIQRLQYSELLLKKENKLIKSFFNITYRKKGLKMLKR